MIEFILLERNKMMTARISLKKKREKRNFIYTKFCRTLQYI